MTWSRAKLEQATKGRLAKLGTLQPVEKAALAYARWQGLTHEDDVDTEAAKRSLDKTLAGLSVGSRSSCRFMPSASLCAQTRPIVVRKPSGLSARARSRCRASVCWWLSCQPCRRSPDGFLRPQALRSVGGQRSHEPRGART